MEKRRLQKRRLQVSSKMAKQQDIQSQCSLSLVEKEKETKIHREDIYQ